VRSVLLVDETREYHHFITDLQHEVSLHVNLDQTKYVVFNILFGMQNDKFSYKMKKKLK
jgi:hypothetical protein